MTTHLRAGSPSGRIVRFANGTWVCGWADEHEPGRRGYLAITADGRAAVAIRDTGREAIIEVCNELGLDKRYVMGKGAPSA